MKVLHLLQSDRFSGAENVVCQIINMFRNDTDIEMVYCSSDGQIREALRERDIKFIPLKGFSVNEVKRAIKDEKPDLIHAHDMRASFLVALVCGKIPLVSHIHNNSFDSRKLSVKAVLYRIAAKKAKHIFWVSNSAFEGYYYHKKIADKSSVLYNVIDVEQVRKKAEEAENQDAYDVVYVGRLTYPKNPERLISVLEKAIAIAPNLQAAIIGNGDLEDQVKGLIKQKGLEKNIHCLGFMNNPCGLLKNAKVMIMTSRWEGTPMCALEAMALGVPIVSTPTDGLRDLVKDGRTGYLSNEDDSLASDLVSLIRDDSSQKAFSCTIFECAKRINDVDRYKQKLKAQYE